MVQKSSAEVSGIAGEIPTLSLCILISSHVRNPNAAHAVKVVGYYVAVDWAAHADGGRCDAVQMVVVAVVVGKHRVFVEDAMFKARIIREALRFQEAMVKDIVCVGFLVK